MNVRFLCIVVFLIISLKINYLIGLEILLFTFTMGFISYKYFPKIKKKNEIINSLNKRGYNVTNFIINGIKINKVKVYLENNESILLHEDVILKNDLLIKKEIIVFFVYIL